MATTAAYDRTESWRLCCLRILGFDGEMEMDADANETAPFLNLLPNNFFQDDSAVKESTAALDTWMATSDQLQENMKEMMSFLESKKATFAVSMSDQEASLVQTTLTSFTAQTAVELERLHATASSPHRVGMIQILMDILKTEIADPFARLSKRRSESITVSLYRNPLQCRLLEPQDDGSGILGALEDQLDQRFAPTRPTHRLHENFWDSYLKDPSRSMKKPKSWVQGIIKKSDNMDEEDNEEGKYSSGPPDTQRQEAKPSRPIPVDDWPTNTDTNTLQQESMVLQQQMAQHNELDSIHQVETAMVTITQLMAQFADLVSEQQANVFEIHDNVDHAARAVQAGKEALVDAKHKTTSSQHYMAKGITAMGVLLLLFHFISR